MFVYHLDSRKVPYQVYGGSQSFVDQDRITHDCIGYKIITRGNDCPPAGSHQIARRICFADWTIRNVHFRKPPLNAAEDFFGPPRVVAVHWYPSGDALRYNLVPL